MPIATARTTMRAKARVATRPARAPRPRQAPTRKQPQQARSRAMVDSILDAAARVLREHGYDDATTNRVAEVAGVSVGSVYQYFPNKEAMVYALIERHDAAMWAVFADHATVAIGKPFAEAIPVVIDALFTAHLVDPALHTVLHQQLPRSGALHCLRATNERALVVVENMLRARPDQHARADDVATTALVIVEAVEALIHASLELPPARAHAVQRHASELVLRYLGAPS
jgi:AcrR family transcriptional regulator